MANPVCTCTHTTSQNSAFPGCHHEAACPLYRTRAAHYEVDLRPGALTPIDGDVCGPHAPPVTERGVAFHENGPCDPEAECIHALLVEDDPIAAARARAPEVGLNPKDLIGATKTPLGLLPWTALVQVARVFAAGAKKYGAYNWRTKGQPVQHVTYVEAAFRHLAAYMDGETLDPETGCNHLAHAVTGLLILLDASAIGNALDNRPTPGLASELLAIQSK